MICYTLAHCVFENLSDSNFSKIVGEILSVFLQTNSPHKLAIDSEKRILDIYLSIGANSIAIQSWLQLIGQLKNWDAITIPKTTQNISNEELVKLICSNTEDKLLIVYSHNGWTKGQYATTAKQISYNGELIQVLDRDEAAKRLSQPSSTTINIDAQGSVVAVNSHIEDTTNRS